MFIPVQIPIETAQRFICMEAQAACTHCGWAGRMRAYGMGRTYAVPGFDDRKGVSAKFVATRRASRLAEARARLLLEIAPCPQCGHRDLLARARFARRQRKALFASGALALLFILGLDVCVKGGLSILIGGSPFLLPLVVFIDLRLTWRAAAREVEEVSKSSGQAE